MNKVELLAPAGTKEAFIHAINAGANAIFMAGQKFGARAFATNFTVEDIIDAIAYAHLRHVLVYITINTLTFDDEIEDLLAYTDDLVKHHVDALIVQDIGVMALLIQRYPNTAIHASTQVNAHHVSQVKFLKSLGVKRVILARETNLQTIKEIKKAVDIELEVFIHGALCISYSGNCLMSSILNHRSGNRGSCAYSCRLPYQLLEENKVISDKTYLLSAKDLMTLEYIDELIEAGIDSFKIEGRMRKETYVSQTVAIYRKSMEAYNQQKTLDLTHDIDLLKRVFNRAYTKGYMFDEIPKDINNDFRPNHIGINIGKVIDYKQSYALIQLTESLENGDGFRIIGDHDYGNIVTFMKNTNDEVVKKALLNDQVWLKIKERVSIGDLVYKTLDAALEKSLSVFSDENYKLIPLKGYVKAFRGDYLSFYLTDDDGHEVSVISANPLDAANRRPLLKIDLIK
ncbi:MAG: U32 family peptidase, partial [Acholeplasmataceae bacterium]